MTGDSPTPRRVSGPSWLDLRLIAGVLLVVAAVLGGAWLVSSAARTVQVLSVTHDLSAGTILRAGDVRAVAVRLPDRGRYLDAGVDVAGRQLNRSVSAGELLPAAALRQQPSLTTVSVPLDDGNAPRLSVGQRIELWLSSGTCASVVLLPDAVVQAVETSTSTALASGSGQNVTLALTPQQAQRVVSALAIDGASIRAGVLTGPAVAPPALPPLDSCSAPAGG